MARTPEVLKGTDPELGMGSIPPPDLALETNVLERASRMVSLIGMGCQPVLTRP